MLKFIYLLSIFVNLFYMLLSKKKLTFVSIYFLSSVIYYLNLFFGETFEKVDNVIVGKPLSSETYFILIINSIFILFFQLLPNFSSNKKNSKKDDNSEKNSTRKISAEKLAIELTSIIIFIVGLYVVQKFNIFSLTVFNKSEILESTSFIDTYFKNFSLFLFIYIFTVQRYKPKKFTYLLITASISVTFLLGHRSYVVIGILAILFDYVYRKSNNLKTLFTYIKKHKKLVLILLLFIPIVYSVKGIFNPLITGQYELVKQRLSDINFYLDSFRISESNSIIMYIDRILAYDYRITTSTYKIIPSYFIPFISRFFPNITFGNLLQRDLFPYLRAGSLGSTFIGESLANGGILLFFFIVPLVLLIQKVIFKFYASTNNNFFRTFLLIVGIEFSFYIHRNGLGTVFLRIRSNLYIMIFVFVLYFLIKSLLVSLQKNKFKVKSENVSERNKNENFKPYRYTN